MVCICNIKSPPSDRIVRSLFSTRFLCAKINKLRTRYQTNIEVRVRESNHPNGWLMRQDTRMILIKRKWSRNELPRFSNERVQTHQATQLVSIHTSNENKLLRTTTEYETNNESRRKSRLSKKFIHAIPISHPKTVQHTPSHTANELLKIFVYQLMNTWNKNTKSSYGTRDLQRSYVIFQSHRRWTNERKLNPYKVS